MDAFESSAALVRTSSGPWDHSLFRKIIKVNRGDPGDVHKAVSRLEDQGLVTVDEDEGLIYKI